MDGYVHSEYGPVHVEQGLGVMLLTPCCHATGKGSMADGEPAVVCRSCYTEVDSVFGDIFTDPEGDSQRLADYLTGPHPVDMARHIITVAISR